ncbi:hypothetical protein JCM19046_2128 [Bacillus sp. JCM 19046]|uniref:Membrane protein n=1 Tax=Shouchella xiaoxiensis TaxID=766895 RepID=A0ABS2SMS9_9BACI|nr:hypothetical protein [Shouchella xiaoxiensis]MBM7836826.1 putative membrane protein [Shouchella xiaoxiensis]GAF10996.1 hypothetical protein JCM19045_69 [Bacillus sp. JCM 19045]GAF17606.1 hypothetical protein JCM19046_2128 [Bacillus sp. JCM 19046]
METAFWPIVFIILFLIGDFLWIDQDSKRWNWLRNRSKTTKAVFFSCSLGVVLMFYLVLTFPLG